MSEPKTIEKSIADIELIIKGRKKALRLLRDEIQLLRQMQNDLRNNNEFRRDKDNATK